MEPESILRFARALRKCRNRGETEPALGKICDDLFRKINEHLDYVAHRNCEGIETSVELDDALARVYVHLGELGEETHSTKRLDKAAAILRGVSSLVLELPLIVKAIECLSSRKISRSRVSMTVFWEFPLIWDCGRWHCPRTAMFPDRSAAWHLRGIVSSCTEDWPITDKVTLRIGRQLSEDEMSALNTDNIIHIAMLSDDEQSAWPKAPMNRTKS